MLSFQVTFILFALFKSCLCKTISLPIVVSHNNYSYTTIQWGTPAQSFNVLIDTTDHTSWIYNHSVTTNQPKFNPGASSTYVKLYTRESFGYQTEWTTIEFAIDVLTIDNSISITNTSFGVALQNFSILEVEQLSGFLGLNKLNEIISRLWTNDYITNNSVSIDMVHNKMYLGPYIPSNFQNKSQAVSCSNSTNSELQKIWTFDMKIAIDGHPTLRVNSFKGVIDSASPFITIYAASFALFEQLWQMIDRSYYNPGSPNCNYTTRYCSTTDIMSYMSLFINDNMWNISIFRKDILYDNYIQFFHDPDTVFTTDTDFVLFLGRPFLKHVMVTLDSEHDTNTMTFYSLEPTLEPTIQPTLEPTSQPHNHDKKEKITVMQWIITGVGILIIVIIVIGCACYLMKKRRKGKDNEQQQENLINQ